jgi:hypothetical protein
VTGAPRLGLEAPKVLVALPLQVPRARAVRGTLILQSQQALREAGLFDDYWRCLPAQHRDALFSPLAGAWLGIDLAMAHYEGCDGLSLSEQRVDELGRAVGTRINGVFLQSLRKLAGNSVTPWFAWEHAQRIWARAWDGSAIGVARLGPKDARVTVAGFPCAEFGYVKRALSGFFLRNTELFCARAFVKAVPTPKGSESLVYDVSWV